MELDPWQRLCLDVGMRVHPDGSWAASQVGLLVPRQNGKTAVLVARILGGLVLLGENQLLAAHRMHVTLETWRTVVDLLHGDPVLRRLVTRVDRANGQEALYLRGRPNPDRPGARLRPRLEVIAGTPRARGPRGKDLLVVDELREVPAPAWAALTPTASSPSRGIGRSQTWTASNAGTDASDILNDQRDRGRDRTDPRLAWLEWSTDLTWDDPAGWWQANPALGLRKDPELLADEARRSAGDPAFRTEHLCQWVAALGDGLDLRAWAAAADPQLPDPPRSPVLAVDITPARTDAAIAAAWRTPTGRVCARMLWTGPPWLLADAVEAARTRLRPTLVVYDPATAEGVASEQRRRPWTAVTARQSAGGCQTLSDLLAAGLFGHAPDDELDAAAAGAVKRPRGDGWGWGRRQSGINIAPLVAVTLAVAGLDLAPTRARVVLDSGAVKAGSPAA